MAAQGLTTAQTNKRIRQEALREQLSKQAHVQHVIDISEKLQSLDKELEQTEITRLKYAADLKLKLINKYLPDLKAMEIEGDIEHSGGLTITWAK